MQRFFHLWHFLGMCHLQMNFLECVIFRCYPLICSKRTVSCGPDHARWTVQYQSAPMNGLGGGSYEIELAWILNAQISNMIQLYIKVSWLSLQTLLELICIDVNYIVSVLLVPCYFVLVVSNIKGDKWHPFLIWQVSVVWDTVSRKMASIELYMQYTISF